MNYLGLKMGSVLDITVGVTSDDGAARVGVSGDVAHPEE